MSERWFAEFTTKRLRRGTHCSVKGLARSITDWVGTSNDDPRPYVWDKTADEIFDSLAAYCQRISESGDVVLAADGESNVVVADRVGVNQATVVKGRKRFIERGLGRAVG